MLLDEPTNHLDMSSQEILQEAMKQYDGTIIVVSHNRYFLDCFVNKVLEVKQGEITCHEGTVSEYLRKQDELAAREQRDHTKGIIQDTTKELGGRERKKNKRREEARRRQERHRRAGNWLKKLAEAEKEVEILETQKAELETLMADPELYQDSAGWSETSAAYEKCSRRLDRWLERWEEAQVEIDKIDAELSSS